MRSISISAVSLFSLILTGLPILTQAEPSASDIHQTTTLSSDARFEIVQSQLAAKWTFRLDRYTGNVSQLVRTQDGGIAWRAMLALGIPEVSMPSKPRFVIFTSGLAARHTFLMDTDTGNTWVLETISHSNSEDNSSDLNVWKPFEQ